MKKLTVLFFCTAISRCSWSAIAVDSQEASGAGHRSIVSPLSWTFTNTAGTKLVCGFVATCSGANVASISTPTYGGTLMTNVSSQFRFSSTPNVDITAMYYLDNPATGANTVSVTWGGTSSPAALGGCISFTGTNTGVGTATTGSGTSGTTATAGAITTASGNYIFAEGGWGSGTGGTAGAGFTRTYLINGSGVTAGDNNLGEYQSSAGSAITPTFTWTGSDNWGIIAVEITAASGGAGVAPSSFRRVVVTE